MKTLFKDLSPQKRAAIEMALEGQEFENFFFNKVKDHNLFFPLIEKGFFDAKKNPAPMPSEKNDGFFTIPSWSALDYLELVSIWAGKNDEQEYIETINSIIIDITRDGVKDNYRTFWKFVKIISNFPNNFISFEVLDLIPLWLDCRFESEFIASEIYKSLLTKFLVDPQVHDNDCKKAEKILLALTKLKWRELPRNGQSPLSEKMEPYLAGSTYYLANLVLKKTNIDRIIKRCGDSFIYNLADNLQEILNRRSVETWRDIDFEFEEKLYRLSFFFEWDFKVKLKVYIIDSPDSEPQELFGENSTVALHDADEFYSFIDKTLFTNKSHAWLKSEFNPINYYFGVFDDYSYIWIKSFEKRGEPVDYGLRETLSSSIMAFLTSLSDSEKESTLKLLDALMGTKYKQPIFLRMALNCIGHNWEKYGHLFMDLLNKEYCWHYFESLNYESELFNLLKLNVSKFNKIRREKISSLIEVQFNSPIKRNDKQIHYFKQKWYSALNSDPYFDKEYQKYQKLTNIEEEWSFEQPTVIAGPGPSPLTIEEIIKMSNKELSLFIEEFEGDRFLRGPTIDGLCKILKQTIRENPNKFVDNLEAFKTSGYLYIYNILGGLIEAWNEKKSFDWEKLLKFIQTYIDQKDFWRNKFVTKGDDWPATKELVLGEIGNLIQVGTRNDNWAIPENHNEFITKLIQYILKHMPMYVRESKVVEPYDPLTQALNSAYGKILSGLIDYSLRIARFTYPKEDKTPIKWNKELKTQYEFALDLGIDEAFTWTGYYIHQFTYLDFAWINKRIIEFVKLENNDQWFSFMYGYLFRNKVYEDLMDIMYGHYKRALISLQDNEKAMKLVISHIMLGHLHDFNGCSYNDLLGDLLNQWRHPNIKKIIEFFWSRILYNSDINENDEIDYDDKALEFWEKLHNEYKKRRDILSDDEKDILSDSLKLIIYLRKIEENSFKWLMLAVPYVHNRYNSPQFIFHLNRLKNYGDPLQNTDFIGQLFKKMLEYYLPDYDEEHIKSIVEFIFINGDQDTKAFARDICNTYAKKDRLFLEETYKKYNT